jgi:hypothetical protein
MTKTNKMNMNPKSNKTKKIRLANKTPKDIYDLSVQIQNQVDKKRVDVSSYAPTVNKYLVSLKSLKREPLYDCNNERAYQLKEPLKIGVKSRGSKKIKCLSIDDKKVIKQELKALKANKHIDVDKIITPVQSLANCWFNTMFMSFFVSDKGRKFFHYFRQLMIEGKQASGEPIPKKLHNAFALLNYAIESTLVGTEFAYKMDTNSIIKKIYNAIPKSFKTKFPYIVDIDQANSPIRYYASLMEYLGNNPLDLLLQIVNNNDWSQELWKTTHDLNMTPHIIILEIFDGENKTAGNSGKITNRPTKFRLNGHKYILDSCIIRDTTQQHFCSTLTCEGKEYAYDGFSYKRLVKMHWKNKINKNFEWEFEGSINADGSQLKWNFLKGYQMLFYYRVN